MTGLTSMLPLKELHGNQMAFSITPIISIIMQYVILLSLQKVLNYKLSSVSFLSIKSKTIGEPCKF